MKFTDAGLNQEQLQVLKLMGGWLAEQGFYLAGGTALAIYFKHRRSVDLDWFTGNAIPNPLVFAQRLRDTGLPFETGQTAPGTLYGQMGSVRASFIEFRYPLLQALERWLETGVVLAGLNDLACMKLSAIAQRGSKRDFYDVHALLARHYPLGEFLELYQQKFGVSDISPVLYGLAYFDDAEKEPEPMLLEQISWKQVKIDILQWLKEVTRTKGK